MTSLRFFSVLRILVIITSIIMLSVVSYANVNTIKPVDEIVNTNSTNDFQNIGTAGILTILVLREVFEYLRKRDVIKKTPDLLDIKQKIDVLKCEYDSLMKVVYRFGIRAEIWM